MANDDMELVRAYALRRSEAAFEKLVSRHVNLVYSAAIRRVADPHVAEEVTQAVFIILARKAGALDTDTILPSWLYRTAGFVAADALKSRHRRAQREQEAYMQSTISEQDNETWPQIAPLLDAAVDGLSEMDRRAIVLRFFKNQSLNEVGTAIGSSEEAAKKRVNRALEKLRHYFKKRGISSTAAVIAGAISANSIQVAPMTLATLVAATAIAKGAAASTSTLTLVKGALKIMAWTKMKTAVAVGALIILTAGTATIVVKAIYFPARTMIFSSDGFTWYLGSFEFPSGRSANVMKMMPYTINAQSVAVVADGSVSWHLKDFSSPPGTDTTVNPATTPTSGAAIKNFGDWAFGQWIPDTKIFEKFPPMLLIRPAQEPVKALSFQMFGRNQYLAENRTVKELITSVYSQKNSTANIVFLAPLPEDKLDCVVTLQNIRWFDALEIAIKKRFNLVMDYQSTDAGSTVTVKNAP